jgi:hypothetical protein
LTVFLDAALAKKYTNPSSDVISVLAGLHDADAVMTDFIATLDTVIRNGRSSMCHTGCRRKYLLIKCSPVATQGCPGHALHHCCRLPHRTAVLLYTP